MQTRLRIFVAALALGSLGAHAETFVVTRFDDPFPDTCLPNDCSLREATIAASSNDPFAGTDRIELVAGTYTVIRGALPPDEGLELVGAGSTQTFVVTDVSLFGDVHGKTLTLRGMSLQSTDLLLLVMFDDSRLSLDDIAVPPGGGRIYITDTSDLEASDSDLRSGVHCIQSDGGSCTLVDSQLVEFDGRPSSIGHVGPDVLLRRTTIDGQLDPSNPSSGLVLRVGKSFTIEDSDIVHTTVGLWVASFQSADETPPVTLRRVRYLDNSEPIYTAVSARLQVFDSEFRDNPKRAIHAAHGANVSISGSTFADNQVDDNAGGAILIQNDSVVNIQNSTFSGNTFTAAAAQAGARGGAIGFRNNSAGAHLTLRHATIVAPAFGAAGVEGTALGGYANAITLDVSNSILRGSCKLDAGVLANNAGNIESAGHSCGLDTQLNRVDVAASALAIGTLGDHGGLTLTYEPAAGSVAIDNGSTPQCLAIDQRGYARPAGLRGDVGAVEVGAIDDTIFADGFD